MLITLICLLMLLDLITYSGPNGMNKLVVNHLGKIIVTSDCATIVKELEIEHPAAKMLQMAAEMQDSECGDGTNLTVSFAGELLKETQELIRMGLHTSEIIQGYKKAGDKLQDTLPSLVLSPNQAAVTNPRDIDQLIRICTPVLAAKASQAGSADLLAPLVAEACIGSMNPHSKAPKVQAESVRVAKILGGNVSQSRVIHGMVLLRGCETITVTHVKNAKITIFGCGIEASGTEAKGTVLMKDADDLMNYNKSEEAKMDEIIKAISETGTNLVVSGGTVSEMALHFIEKYGMMCIKVSSKWDLRRLCSATNSTALVRLGPATSEEMGHCDEVKVQEIGGRFVTIFSHSEATAKDGCRISTILLRASTSSLLNDLERAVDDGVAACRIACKDGRLLPGAGATEMELSLQLKQYGDMTPGLDQYAIRAFGQALEFVPRTLARNSGQDATNVLAALGAAHANGDTAMGIDISGDNNGICRTVGDNNDENSKYLVDLYATKASAFRLAVDAALTVLRVDQIIMSKPAGGGQAMQ